MLQATVQRPLPGNTIAITPESVAGVGRGLVSSPTKTSFLLPVIATALVPIAGLYLLFEFWETVVNWGSWGYLGVFLAELVNSSVILVPTPGPAYTFAMGVTLDPFALGLIGGIGATIGELAGYILGAKSKQAVEGGRVYERFRALTKRWTGGALFAFALLPVPFDVAGVWAGATSYPVWRFLLFVTPGKVLKVTTMALAGSYSVAWLLGPFTQASVS